MPKLFRVGSLAVELAKLSLWLTCIATDEPLNFLDHHLRPGNALLGSSPEEMRRLPNVTDDEARDGYFDIGDGLTEALAAVIAQTAEIESQLSTEMEVVKAKEQRWRQARKRLAPFVELADVWIAALDGLPINHLDYRALALSLVKSRDLTSEQRRTAEAVAASISANLNEKRELLQPFHWKLEFAEVFYDLDGTPLPEERCGFDAVLGNPPYVSTHTSSEQAWRAVLSKRAGYLDDLYVHFSDQAFQLLRHGGRIGFIVSDTFFTLETKRGMRQLLQRNRLTHLGQCDPFDATVDAAMFVAQKGSPDDGSKVLFVQARHKTVDSLPEKALETLPHLNELNFPVQAPHQVQHLKHGCLRLHLAPCSLYTNSIKGAYFEPSAPVLALSERFADQVKSLVAEWWERIDSSQRFADNIADIREYQRRLSPGDITILGLVAEGGQGLATANNGRFLGYLAGSDQAAEIERRREELTRRWRSDRRIAEALAELIRRNGGDPTRPTENTAAWEETVEGLKERFDWRRDLGFRRTDLYRIARRDSIAGDNDFELVFQKRKAELLEKWQTEQSLEQFWRSTDAFRTTRGLHRTRGRLNEADDAAFCDLCMELLEWWATENRRRDSVRPAEPRIPRSALGLRSSERYSDPIDARRIAVIYNGLRGSARWVPFRKGDSMGNQWVTNDPLFIDWREESVDWLFDNSGRRAANMPVVRNPHLYFLENITWSRTGNHTPIKARVQPKCVFDSDSTVLTPIVSFISANAFLAILNSHVLSFFCKKLLNNTNKYEITDLRMLPLVVPTSDQNARLSELAKQAIEAKEAILSGGTLSSDSIDRIRELTAVLRAEAPGYLRPTAQNLLFANAGDCLSVVECAVNWEVEKLYGIERLGPFDEF